MLLTSTNIHVTEYSNFTQKTKFKRYLWFRFKEQVTTNKKHAQKPTNTLGSRLAGYTRSTYNIVCAVHRNEHVTALSLSLCVVFGSARSRIVRARTRIDFYTSQTRRHCASMTENSRKTPAGVSRRVFARWLGRGFFSLVHVCTHFHGVSKHTSVHCFYGGPALGRYFFYDFRMFAW